MYAALGTSIVGDNADADVVVIMPTKINDGKPQLQ